MTPEREQLIEQSQKYPPGSRCTRVIELRALLKQLTTKELRRDYLEVRSMAANYTEHRQ